ncbi:MAG: glycoside hydrolase family 16 protein [Chloroflexi bacterium]|nr:glycoside hydrolase family 16 protein [Chloroflexota bacterium]
MTSGDIPANPLDKPGYWLEFNDEFESDQLNLDRWVPYYLPHWSSREQSTPRYAIQNNMLVLKIEEDQPPWCPEFNGDVKCSSIQTGLFAGAVGSNEGQHLFNEACIVREAQTTRRTYTPQYGYFETRMKVVQSNLNMVALWMIGFEEMPQESGEILIFEVFGDQMTPTSTEVRCGIHPWGDESLTDEFYRYTLPMNAAQFHIYAVEWQPTGVDFYVDNVKRRTIRQSPAYPMQFMLSMYEFPGEDEQRVGYPRQFIVDYFRGYQPMDGYSGV